MIMPVYKEPFYYEIAFSFINPKKQVDLFEKFIEKFSKIQVKRFLDIGCGPSLQLRQIAKRGYEAVGLDSSSRMLEYLKRKAKEEGITIETIKADMIDFKMDRKIDFAFAMMGTINYVKSNGELLSHFNSVAESLNSGGLYLIENFRLDWTSKNLFRPQSWMMKKNGIKVKTTYSIRVKDTLNQILEETIKLDVNDNRIKHIFQEAAETKIIFPQEFLELVKLNSRFEFLGWFERNKLRALNKAKMDNIVLLRRK